MSGAKNNASADISRNACNSWTNLIVMVYIIKSNDNNNTSVKLTLHLTLLSSLWAELWTVIPWHCIFLFFCALQMEATNHNGHSWRITSGVDVPPEHFCFPVIHSLPAVTSRHVPLSARPPCFFICIPQARRGFTHPMITYVLLSDDHLINLQRYLCG